MVSETVFSLLTILRVLVALSNTGFTSSRFSDMNLSGRNVLPSMDSAGVSSLIFTPFTYALSLPSMSLTTFCFITEEEGSAESPAEAPSASLESSARSSLVSEASASLFSGSVCGSSVISSVISVFTSVSGTSKRASFAYAKELDDIIIETTVKIITLFFISVPFKSDCYENTVLTRTSNVLCHGYVKVELTRL